MLLALIIVGMLVLALGLAQAWNVWYFKREIQRLEFRLNESLDDEDLIEFQERLQGLLVQSRETVAGLAENVDKRRNSLEASLEKAIEVEKRLALRTLERVAQEPKPAPVVRRDAAKAPYKSAGPAAKMKTDRNGKDAPTAIARGRNSQAPSPPPEPSAPPLPKAPANPDAAEAGTGREARNQSAAEKRSYLVRPAVAQAASRYQAIYDLADEGLNHEQIAKRAGILPGEVNLILNLRKKGA